MGACSSKSSVGGVKNQVAQALDADQQHPVVGSLAVDVGASPIEAAKIINKAINQHQVPGVSTPTMTNSSISVDTVSPSVSPPSTQQKRMVHDSLDGTSSGRRSVRVVSLGTGGVDSVKKSCRADSKKQANMFDLSLDLQNIPQQTAAEATVGASNSGIGSVKQGTLRDAASPMSGRRLLQYPSERELSTHRENSVKAMHKRAGSVSRATESESDEELEVDGANAGNQGNNSNVRLLNSVKSPRPNHGRRPSLSTNGPQLSLQVSGRDSPSQRSHRRNLSSYDSAGPMNGDLDASSSPRNFVSPPTGPRTLGLARDSTELSSPVNWKKRELSLAHQVLQRQLLAAEQMNQQQSSEGAAQPEEEVSRSTNEYAPPPYQLGGSNSPLLSFRRLPSRSRQNSISISGTPGSPHGSYSSTLMVPGTVNVEPPSETITDAAAVKNSVNHGSPTGLARVCSPVHGVDVCEEQTAETLADKKVERVWAHYTGRSDAKEMGKKGLYQLGSDVYDEFCARYKERMVALKREKSEEQVKKGGKALAPYTMEHAERDLQADLPYMLPANSARGSDEPTRKEYVKYICKFLYSELTKCVNSGLASMGKGGHQRSRSALMGRDATGTASMRMRSNSISKNQLDFSMCADRLPEANTGLESFSSPAVSVKIRKMEFVLGWKRAQEALFQAIEQIKTPANNSTCRLM